MTYGDVKRLALQLAFTDTVAGQEIPGSYNGQADYLLQIPGLVDSALTDITLRGKRLPAAVALAELPSRVQGGYTVYTLPADYRELMHGGLVALVSDGCGGQEFRCYRQFRFLGGELAVPRSAPGELTLEYWRAPASVGSAPSDSAPLDGTPDMHRAIPYFVAAQLVMYDDGFRYQALRSEYEVRVAALRDGLTVEEVPIRDAYFGGDE